MKKVARQLRRSGLRVFYDEDEIPALWGQNLAEKFHQIYSQKSRYCILFISAEYAGKSWTRWERRSILERMLDSGSGYVLPARFDTTELEGINSNIGYVDLRDLSAGKFAKLVVEKIRPELVMELQSLQNYLPPDPDLVIDFLEPAAEEAREAVRLGVYNFFDRVAKMNAMERRVVGTIFAYGCPGELPELMHMSTDIVRRALGISAEQVRGHLQDIRSLGFETEFRFLEPEIEDIALSWKFPCWEFESVLGLGHNCTVVGAAMCKMLSDHYCDEHFMEQMSAANFSALSSTTSVPDSHE